LLRLIFLPLGFQAPLLDAALFKIKAAKRIRPGHDESYDLRVHIKTQGVA